MSDDAAHNIAELDGAKWGSATAMVPPALGGGARTGAEPYEVGDVLLAEIEKIGAHDRLEGREGQRQTLYPGDRVVGVLGHRYAPDQFEGYAEVHDGLLHLLSGAGVLGTIRSRHDDHSRPTRAKLLGALTDLNGQKLNTRQFGLRPAEPLAGLRPLTIAVVGTMMNAGKTTAAASIVRGAARRGRVVAAAKITGTASMKDVSLMRDAGARRSLDFTACGWPSTYLCSAAELEDTFLAIYGSLLRIEPAVVVLELSDGIIQRETAMLLRAPAFTSRVDTVVLAAGDALGAEAGVGRLRTLGLPVQAVSGRTSMSPLLVAETESVTGLPCLTRSQLEEGAALELVPQAAGVQ